MKRHDDAFVHVHEVDFAGEKRIMTDDFLAHLQTIPGSCSQSVKESHWKTWQRAQEILIAASGAPVLITTLPVQQRAEVL